MTHVNIAGRIRTQPDVQTGTLGEALKAKLAEPEQVEQIERVTLTLTPLPNSHRLAFTLTRDGHPTKRGTFLNADHAAAHVGLSLRQHPSLTVIRKELTA